MLKSGEKAKQPERNPVTLTDFNIIEDLPAVFTFFNLRAVFVFAPDLQGKQAVLHSQKGMSSLNHAGQFLAFLLFLLIFFSAG